MAAKILPRQVYKRGPEATNGWGWLLFGFLVALFVGGAIRGLLSPQKIKLLIDSALQAGRPPFSLRFDSAELSLRDGVLPRLGILARGIRIEAKDPCITASDLEIRELFVPISLTEALLGRFFVRRIQAMEAQLHLRTPQCPNPQIASSAEGDIWIFFEKFFKTRFAQELVNTREQLEGVEVEDFKIYRNNEIEPLVKLSYVRIDTGSGSQPARARARLEVDKKFVGSSVAPYVWIDLVAELNRIELSLRTLFREGLIEGQATLSLPDTTVQWHADVKHFPVKPLYDRFLAGRFVDWGFNLEGAWAFCHLQSSATFVRVLSDWTYLSQCYVEGSLGQLRMAPTRLRLAAPWPLNPANVEVHDLALARLFLEGERLSFGLFEVEPTGIFNGTVLVKDSETTVLGRVQHVELGFWRGLVRGRQPVNSATIEWKLTPTDDLLRISEIQSQGTFWQGQISLKRNHENANHEFQIGLKDVKLDRSLAHLFVAGELQPFEIRLQGGTNKERLTHLSGDFNLPKISGPAFSLENLKASVTADDKQFLGRCDAQNVKIFDHSILDGLKPLLEDSKGESSDLAFDRVRGQWEYRGQTVTWKDLKLLASGSASRWMSDGDFDRDQMLSATAIRIDTSGNWTKWRLAGVFPLSIDIQKDSLPKPPDRSIRQMLEDFDSENGGLRAPSARRSKRR